MPAENTCFNSTSNPRPQKSASRQPFFFRASAAEVPEKSFEELGSHLTKTIKRESTVIFS